MDLESVILSSLFGLFVGYLLGTWRDRFSAIRSKEIEAITRLHEQVLMIEKMELSDGRQRTLGVPVEARRKQEGRELTDEEVDYLAKLTQWREQLREEEDRAGLWIDRQTIGLVRNYCLLMMLCSRWDDYGTGNPTDDDQFKHYLRAIFGSEDKVSKKIIEKHSQTGKAVCFGLCPAFGSLSGRHPAPNSPRSVVADHLFPEIVLVETAGKARTQKVSNRATLITESISPATSQPPASRSGTAGCPLVDTGGLPDPDPAGPGPQDPIAGTARPRARAGLGAARARGRLGWGLQAEPDRP